MNLKFLVAMTSWAIATACITSAPTNAFAGASPDTRNSAQHEAGRKIYNFRCYFCHGYSGNAQTVAASFIKPAPFDFTSRKAAWFTPEHIVSVLQKGKVGTAMPSFRNTLSESEMKLVAAFVIDEFVRRKAPNTRYHTAENGWPNHQRYKAAFPFATGEISVGRPWETLNPEQVRGKRLFLSSCVTCHDRGDAHDKNSTPWETRPVSYPRNNFSFTAPPPPDAISSASPYRLHDLPLNITGMTPLEAQGQKLWQDNCAFCHATDGTGKNWIGMFLEPHPRNLRDPAFMGAITRARLSESIREGLTDTSMPAWKNVLSDKEISAVVAYISKAFHPVPN